jgi:hypothetical protein
MIFNNPNDCGGDLIGHLLKHWLSLHFVFPLFSGEPAASGALRT